MNGRKHPWKRLIAAMLAALLIGQIIPAYAVEPDGEPETTPQATESPATAPDDVGADTDVPEPEAPVEGPEMAFVTVSTLEELLQAIDEAEAGATIGVGCEITCPDETTLGNPDKLVTIQRTAPEGTICFTNGDGTGSATIQNIIFDGGNVESFNNFVSSALSATFTGCSFVNVNSTGGIALAFENGRNTLTGCTFNHNTGLLGSHLRISTTATIDNCTFTNGAATLRAGAILIPSGSVTMTGCTITGNHAAELGGGIWNSGTVDIEGCKIYGNTTGDGVEDDILNDYYGRLILRDSHAALLALYAPDGLTPNKWAVDTITEEESFGPDRDTKMIFSMTFAEPAPVEPDPEPEEPDPTPTPEPEPEPTPTPEPDPEPTPEPTPTPEPATPSTYRPSSGHSRPAVTVEEEPKEITLTNGRAVLKAPEAGYWAGYVNGHAGGAGSLTRAELPLLVVSMMDQEEPAADPPPFDDVDAGSPYAAAIGTTFSAGIMVGVGNRQFAPEGVLTWAELITVFSRFAGDDIPPEVFTGQHWAKDAINTAISLGWLEYSEAFDPGGVVTCGQAVDFIQTVFQWASD